MNIVEPSVELLDIPKPDDRLGVLKFIESVGRTCYKSEDRITEDSAIKFVNMLKERNHWAMLEHYIFNIVIDAESHIARDIYNIMHNRLVPSNIDDRDILGMLNTRLNFRKEFLKFTRNSGIGTYYILSASATTLNYLWNILSDFITPTNGFSKVCWFLYKIYPELIVVPKRWLTITNPKEYDLSGIWFVNDTIHETMNVPDRMLHDWVSVKFIVNRQVSHELVRHRQASWAQESTRYCNYSKAKFGNQLSFINPSNLLDSPEAFELWKSNMEMVERSYFSMLGKGCTAQMAAQVLPNAIKTEVIMTARLVEMRHFFHLRAHRAAHPQMQEVAYPLFDLMFDKYPEIFGDFDIQKDSNN